jgi:hypothetical protein
MMSTPSITFDLDHLSKHERQTVRLIEDFVRRARMTPELFPALFGVSLTAVRENLKLRAGEAKHRAWRPCRYRLKSDRLVVFTWSTRMQMIFNGDGRLDGFDYTLLRRHWELNKSIRRDIGAMDDLTGGLVSLLDREWIIAPRTEPYVSLLYARDGLAEAVREWELAQRR